LEVSQRTLNSFAKNEMRQDLKVYLASAEAFKNYCENCSFLVKVEETGHGVFAKRVFCRAEKCAK
jgi:hypothetical protein